MRDLRRKLLSLGNHFFEWLKTANISIVCGTVTLKSPPPRGSDAPHVHPRPRKRPPRCTLDCGFKTSESPALRGFVGGPQALATAALYLVIFSNGLHRSKNLPVKFDFSLKTVPANIAKKLPPQCCSKPLLIPFFNFSHKWPTFASQAKVGTHSPFRERSHTAAHTPKQGRFGWGGGITTLGAFRTFTNIPGPGIRTTYFAAFRSWSEALLKDTESLRNSDAHKRVAVPQASRPRWAA